MGSLGFPELDLVYSNVIGGRRCGGGESKWNREYFVGGSGEPCEGFSASSNWRYP